MEEHLQRFLTILQVWASVEEHRKNTKTLEGQLTAAKESHKGERERMLHDHGNATQTLMEKHAKHLAHQEEML